MYRRASMPCVVVTVPLVAGRVGAFACRTYGGDMHDTMYAIIGQRHRGVVSSA